MKTFFKNLFLALIPITVINAICWGGLIFLAWQDDLQYVNYASALDKEKRLVELADSARLVIIGGSNARFGYDCQILKDTLEIEPVNMGVHIGLGLDYMFEEVREHLKEGDVLLVSPEYQHFLSLATYRGGEGLTDMYLVKHEWFKAFRHVMDTQNYLSMYRLIRRRIKRIDMNPDLIPKEMEVRTKYNQYGDYTGHYHLPSKRWDKDLLYNISPDETVLADVKEKILCLQNRGVEVLLLPPPYSQSSYQVDSLTIQRLSGRLQAEGLSFCVDPRECVYPDRLFYDSRYHLTREGIVLHAKKIAGLLKQML